MPNTTTVTHPDGTVSKRTSKSAIYTHAIQVSPADPVKLYAYLMGQALEADAKAQELRTAAKDGKVKISNRGFHGLEPGSMHSHQAVLTGTQQDIHTHCNRGGMTETWPEPYPAPAVQVPVDEYLRKLATQKAETFEASAAKMREDAKSILAAGTPVGKWSVERWSSRWDLANKALSSFAYLAVRGHTVRVVPVDGPKTEAPAPVDRGDLSTIILDTLEELEATTEAPVDPAEDCLDTCCTGVDPEQDQGLEATVRRDWQAANPDARIAPRYDSSGGWEITCEGGPVCATWWVSTDTEQEARQAYQAHREGRHVQVGDLVTIRGGKDLREVLEVSVDMELVRVVPADPKDTRDPWWVGHAMVRRAEPVRVQWGQVIQVGGKHFAVMSDGEAPYLRPLRP